MAKKEIDDKLPKAPKLTPEQLAKNDEQQAILRGSVPVLDLESPKAMTLMEAKGTQFARALAIIKESESIPLKDMVPVQRANYAKALADIGKFKKAAQIAQDKQQQAYYKGIDKAIWKDDDQGCKCSDLSVFNVDGEETVHDRHHVVRAVWSEKHGKKMNLFRCNSCGLINVR